MKIEIGTVSHGTLQTVDLLQAFAAELERIQPGAELAREAFERVASQRDDHETDSELVNDLQDALDAAAPAGMYFGNTEGDGSDFGWWLNEAGRRFALAEELERAFVKNPRDTWSLRDGAPEWMVDAIHEAHGDMMPNDESYAFARDAATAIAETLRDDLDANLNDAFAAVDGMVSVYHADRFRWLASHLDRASFCDEAREEGLVADDASISDRIAAGMYREAEQVFRAIADAVTDAAA